MWTKLTIRLMERTWLCLELTLTWGSLSASTWENWQLRKHHRLYLSTIWEHRWFNSLSSSRKLNKQRLKIEVRKLPSLLLKTLSELDLLSWSSNVCWLRFSFAQQGDLQTMPNNFQLSFTLLLVLNFWMRAQAMRQSSSTMWPTTTWSSCRMEISAPSTLLFSWLGTCFTNLLSKLKRASMNTALTQRILCTPSWFLTN